MPRATFTVIALLLVQSAFARQIDRVEPPFWWTGFEHNEVQLMIHGESVAALDVSVTWPGVAISRVERVDSENYLFVYLTISDQAQSGLVPIQLSNNNQSVVHQYELRERDGKPRAGFSSADTIYLITPDRFANGDLTNDTIDELGDAHNRNDDFGRHGGDIEGIRQHLSYIDDLGFTQIWLNPVLENKMAHSSYHGYATTDYYKVDPRYGSNESYLAFIEEARARGIGVIKDLIVNHIGTGHWWMQDLPTKSWINHQQDEAKPLSTHARTTNQDPYASDADKAGHADGWFSDRMPDLNQRDPLLADYLIQNAIWWVEYASLSGIRQDTYPYPDKDFMREWTRRIMQEYPNFNIVGEEWSPSPNITAYWQRGKKNHDGYVSYLPTPMDFPLQIAVKKALTERTEPWQSAWTPVFEIVGHDFLYPNPLNLLIFPDNHDMDRIFTQVDEDDRLWRIAISFYLTMRGIPQIFYGTEIQMSHPGTSSHGALRAEFPGGWTDHSSNAFTGKGLTDQQRDALEYTRKLLNWRRETSVIHDGKLMHYVPVGNVYVYFRYNENETVMVVLNRGEAVELDMDRFTQRTDGFTYGTNVVTGNRMNILSSISLPAISALILELQ